MLASTLRHIINQMVVCERRARGESGNYERVTYPQPALVAEYTKNMYYVDHG